MLNSIGRGAKTYFGISTQFFYKCVHAENSAITNVQPEKQSFSIIDTRSIQDDIADEPFENKSPLDKCTEDISHVAPYLKPTFNFAAYVNRSETLQQLVKLGVTLHTWEQKADVPPFILGLDFEKDIKKYIQFFHDIGLTTDDIAPVLSKNPYILREDINNMKVRINYLSYKKFDENMILRILRCNPFWLMFSTERIDRRLGIFQKKYQLSGEEVRQLATKQPKIITYNLNHIKLNHFALKEEMGFSDEEMKDILLKKPKIYMEDQQKLLNTYEYLTNVMKIPLELIVKWPEVLTCRAFRVKQRHLFLEKLGRAQYDPKLPNYVSVLTLVSGNDGDYVLNIAKSSLQAYNAFLKTL